MKILIISIFIGLLMNLYFSGELQDLSHSELKEKSRDTIQQIKTGIRELTDLKKEFDEIISVNPQEDALTLD